VSTVSLTGRVASGPSIVVHEEILEPQFRFEVSQLLPFYLHVEKVLLCEYLRMGLLSADQARRIGAILSGVSAADLVADPHANLSDLAFAIELLVGARLDEPIGVWHVDRSRNDLQACGQMMVGRQRVQAAAGQLLDCFWAVHRLALRYPDTILPGCTHLQPAQVVTPGFHLAGLTGQLLSSVDGLLHLYDQQLDLSPLGAGAMAGQELAWDRRRMARLLGMSAPHPHPLTAVAGRTWVLAIAAECSTLGVVLSRFVTDLMAWGSGQYGFLDLPDELSGISSAMPQKKNFPILERIRGRSAHLLSGYLDIATAQRATPFSNSVEVSKEGSSRLHTLLDELASMLRLLTVVAEHAQFRTDVMREACEREFLGGFSLANALTLDEAVPWRTAQVIAGAYIVAALDRGLTPAQADSVLLAEIAAGRGHALDPASAMEILTDALDPARGLLRKQREGSAHPEATLRLLADQADQARALAQGWTARQDRDRVAKAEVERILQTAPAVRS
jgi:argininosuccinate lyase